MAHLARIFLFYVLLLLSQELLTTTNGRILRQSIHPPNTESTKIMNTATSTTAFAVAKPSHHSKRFLEGDAEAFRPTNPGHSPGVGHSINS